MTENCQNCMYFYYPEKSCLRYPPVLRVGTENGHAWMFPTVESDDWCGEFKAGTFREETGNR